jgi:hypothetical protein
VRISFSRIAKYARCPEQFRQSYQIGRADDSPWAIPGKAFHEAVEQLELRGWEDIDFASRFLSAHISDSVVDRRMRDKSLGYIAPYLERRVHELTNLNFRYYQDSAANGIEVRLEYEFGDHSFIGFIDRVFHDSLGRLVIGDMKTGQPKAQHAVQVQLYNLVWNLTHEEKVSYSQLLYLSDGKTKKDRAPNLQVVMLQIDKQAMHNLFVQFINAMGADFFPPIGALTDACRTCFARKTCQYSSLQTQSDVYLGGKNA